MASRKAWWPLTEQGVQWDGPKPYYNTSDGRRDYIPPIAALGFRDDPKMQLYAQAFGATEADPSGGVPRGGIWTQRGRWDSQRGEYETPTDWAAVGALLVGGFLTAGAANAAMAGGVASGAAAGGPAAAVGNTAADVAAMTAAGGVNAGVAGAAGVGDVAPLVRNAAGVGAMSWLDDAMRIAPVAGDIAGSIITSRANDRASDDMAALTREALEDARREREIARQREDADNTYNRAYATEGRDFNRAYETEGRDHSRAQFATYSQRLQPFITSGAGASSRLEGALGTRAGPPEARMPPGGPQSGQLVSLRAPDGSIRQVPSAQVAHYEQRGARRA